jgi:transposase
LQDGPAVHGPPTTMYNRFHRWARRGIWRQLFATPATADPGGIQDDRQHHRQGTSLGGRRKRDKLRNLIERMFCRLKDWRRIATRYDKLATNFDAAVTLAAVVIWRL